MATISTCLTITPTSRLLTFTSSSSTFHKPLTKPFLPLPYNNRRIINRRNWVSVVPRAAVDLGRDIRPGGAVESDKLPTDVRKRTMDAVDGFGGRVTIGDVASRAGLKLNQAQKALQALAADTDGFLEVSEEGDILYVFPKDYRSKLGAKSFRIKAEPYFEKAKNAGEYVIRVSFGTTLIASIVIVFTAIIAILSSSKSDDDRGERRRSSSYGSGFNFFFSPSDLFWYWDPYYSRKRRVQDDNKFNFIESVFSFVFGDGDPNQGIEEERWKLIGQYISSNGGVVAAEELAPYLDIESTEKIKDDESYMLPVLLRFDGQPVVDEEGNILYRFPSLQKTALQKSRRKEYVGKRWADWVGGVEKFFEEKRWQFSKTSSSERALVVGLGGLNLFGVIVLGTMLKDVPVTVRTDGFIKFVTDIFPLLQIYAGSFFAIPLVRWFLIRKRNSDIEKRNKARQQWAKVLELPDISLTQKLFSARDMAQKTVIGKDQIVYSTDKDFIEQDYEVDEWDKKFRELERSD